MTPCTHPVFAVDLLETQPQSQVANCACLLCGAHFVGHARSGGTDSLLDRAIHERTDVTVARLPEGWQGDPTRRFLKLQAYCERLLDAEPVSEQGHAPRVDPGASS